ncbi:Panacea domain-containing protein [Lysinibacillus xylanilyticus]|uniref:Panacea domain-containing protein n=1 Tax=Lysinibacillus xylanilyticus TaxID=582475 RepID=UPI003CFECB6A
MAKVRDVINYLRYLRDLDEKNGEYYSLSNLKLQKLLYYCQGGHYKWDNEKLMKDAKFEAWRYGPVIPSVYREYNRYGQNDIPALLYEDFNLYLNEEETIKAVWAQLKELHAYTLVNSSHDEAPWVNNYEEGLNNPIRNKEIRKFFREEG